MSNLPNIVIMLHPLHDAEEDSLLVGPHRNVPGKWSINVGPRRSQIIQSNTMLPGAASCCDGLNNVQLIGPNLKNPAERAEVSAI